MVMVFRPLLMETFIKVITFMENLMAIANIFGKIQLVIKAILSMAPGKGKAY